MNTAVIPPWQEPGLDTVLRNWLGVLGGQVRISLGP